MTSDNRCPFVKCAAWKAARGGAMKELDVTTIMPRERHPLIFKIFDDLKSAILLLTNDQIPTALLQFSHERKDSSNVNTMNRGRRPEGQDLEK
jgi:uncharacterized protein (DUF2249 family)